MKLSEAQRHYETFTASLSAVNRQLCFAGIAVVWVFVVPNQAVLPDIPTKLVVSLSFFVIGLAFDLLHYAIASAIWGLFRRLEEKKGAQPDDEVAAPAWLNWVPIGFFWSKAVATLIGYVTLLFAILS